MSIAEQLRRVAGAAGVCSMSVSGVALAQDAGQPTAPAAGEQGGEAADGEWNRLLELAGSMEDRGVEVLERAPEDQ